MVTFHTKANPQGQYYLPKEVREELGHELDLICDTKTAVIYNSETPLGLVLKSLRILSSYIENRLELEELERSETYRPKVVERQFIAKQQVE